MRTITLEAHDGMIVIQEIQRDYFKPEEIIYRWPTRITEKNWLDNWNPESIGKPVYPRGYAGRYQVTGMIPDIALINGAETHCLPIETREVPKPKRVKSPYWRDGYWRNARGQIKEGE